MWNSVEKLLNQTCNKHPPSKRTTREARNPLFLWHWKICNTRAATPKICNTPHGYARTDTSLGVSVPGAEKNWISAPKKCGKTLNSNENSEFKRVGKHPPSLRTRRTCLIPHPHLARAFGTRGRKKILKTNYLKTKWVSKIWKRFVLFGQDIYYEFKKSVNVIFSKNLKKTRSGNPSWNLRWKSPTQLESYKKISAIYVQTRLHNPAKSAFN